MAAVDNKQAVRRFTDEVFNQGQVALIDELCAPDLQYHEPGISDVHGSKDLKRYVTAIRTAFPDMRLTLDDVISEGDQVVTRYTMRGTNTGDFEFGKMHIPATGKKVALTGIDITRISGGKAVEIWEQPDNLGLINQLGLTGQLAASS